MIERRPKHSLSPRSVPIRFGMPSLRRVRQPAGPATVDVARSVWIRNGRRTRAWASIAVLWSVVFAGLLFVSGDLDGGRTLGQYLGLGVFYFGIAAVGMAFAGRVARAGVWIGTDQIVVRGPFRTRSVALDDAAAFAPGLQGRGGNGTPCPILERRGGRAVGVWALGRRNIWFRYQRLCQEIQPLCEELNELVATLRPGPPSAEPGSNLS
jgi:hypothetical protein